MVKNEPTTFLEEDPWEMVFIDPALLEPAISNEPKTVLEADKKNEPKKLPGTDIKKYQRLFRELSGVEERLAMKVPGTDMSIGQYLAIRKEEGLKIDPATADICQSSVYIFDPYDIDPTLDRKYAPFDRDLFVRGLGSDIWVHEEDLPKETWKAICEPTNDSDEWRGDKRMKTVAKEVVRLENQIKELFERRRRPREAPFDYSEYSELNYRWEYERNRMLYLEKEIIRLRRWKTELSIETPAPKDIASDL
jgi:hypothetical protein